MWSNFVIANPKTERPEPATTKLQPSASLEESKKEVLVVSTTGIEYPVILHMVTEIR